MALNPATSLGNLVIDMWAHQECTLLVMQRALIFGFITQAEYNAALAANPPIHPDDPGSYSIPTPTA